MVIRRVQPLRHDDEQRLPFPARSFLRGPTTDVGFFLFCYPAYHLVPRRRKMGPQVRPCFTFNFDFTHGSGCFKVVSAETGMVVRSCGVTWHQPREPLVFPTSTVIMGMSNLSSGAEPPECVYIQPLPVATCRYCHARHRSCARLRYRRTSAYISYPACHTAPAPAPPLPPPQHQFPIALFGDRGTRRTCACLNARKARRAPCRTHAIAWA